MLMERNATCGGGKDELKLLDMGKIGTGSMGANSERRVELGAEARRWRRTLAFDLVLDLNLV